MDDLELHALNLAVEELVERHDGLGRTSRVLTAFSDYVLQRVIEA